MELSDGIDEDIYASDTEWEKKLQHTTFYKGSVALIYRDLIE